MYPQIIAVLLNVLPLAPTPVPAFRIPSFADAPDAGAVRLAGICVGTAQECLREAMADGELSADEAALPYDVVITFANNSAVLSNEAQTELRDLAGVLNAPLLAGRSFLIEGHTDAVGSDVYNQQLSERRADAVRAFLGTAGVAPERLSSIGYGESRPRVADGRAPENRRVELKILPKN